MSSAQGVSLKSSISHVFQTHTRYPGPMKVAIYARSAPHTPTSAVEKRLRECHDLCDQRGWDSIDYYVDEHVSGRTAPAARPQMSVLLRRLALYDVLVCASLSQLTRRPEHLLAVVEAAMSTSTIVIAADDPRDIRFERLAP